MRLTPILFAFVVAMGMAKYATADVTITYNSDNQPTLIQNLMIDGLTFDVAIDWGETAFNDIYGPGDPPSTLTPYWWNDESGASLAASAIADALNLDGNQSPLVKHTLTCRTVRLLGTQICMTLGVSKQDLGQRHHGPRLYTQIKTDYPICLT